MYRWEIDFRAGAGAGAELSTGYPQKILSYPQVTYASERPQNAPGWTIFLPMPSYALKDNAVSGLV
jgi:hypothetical protein